MGLVRYTVYFNKQQSNSSFTHSWEEEEKITLPAGTQAAVHGSYKHLNCQKDTEGIFIYTVRMCQKKHLMRSLICLFERVRQEQSHGAHLGAGDAFTLLRISLDENQ